MGPRADKVKQDRMPGTKDRKKIPRNIRVNICLYQEIGESNRKNECPQGRQEPLMSYSENG
jgi:hypothetical protein